MHLLNEFLAVGQYRYQPGHVTLFTAFYRAFDEYLGGIDEEWSPRKVAEQLPFPIGSFGGFGLAIGNMAGPMASAAIDREFILEQGELVPRDMTADEITIFADRQRSRQNRKIK